MKKFLTVAAIGALVAVAGCSGKGENAGGTAKREAGNWKTDVKLVKLEVPGMAPEAKTQMTQLTGGASGMDQYLPRAQRVKEGVAAEPAQGRGGCNGVEEEVGGRKIGGRKGSGE